MFIVVDETGKKIRDATDHEINEYLHKQLTKTRWQDVVNVNGALVALATYRLKKE